MKTLRFALSVVGVLFLTLGYLASQVATFRGEASQFAARMDQPPVRWLATALLVAAIVLAFVKTDRQGAD